VCPLGKRGCLASKRATFPSLTAKIRKEGGIPTEGRIGKESWNRGGKKGSATLLNEHRGKERTSGAKKKIRKGTFPASREPFFYSTRKKGKTRGRGKGSLEKGKKRAAESKIMAAVTGTGEGGGRRRRRKPRPKTRKKPHTFAGKKKCELGKKNFGPTTKTRREEEEPKEENGLPSKKARPLRLRCLHGGKKKRGTRQQRKLLHLLHHLQQKRKKSMGIKVAVQKGYSHKRKKVSPKENSTLRCFFPRGKGGEAVRRS